MEDWKQNRKGHVVIWFIYFLINHVAFSPELFSIEVIVSQLIFLAHNAGTAYVVLDWWVPKFFQKKKYGYFLLVSFLTIVFFTVLLGASLFAWFRIKGTPLDDLNYFKDYFLGAAFWSNFGGVTALVLPYFVSLRVQLERRNRQLEKEKLEAELKFLKSQLHPHFLFNALNNIYFLIKKDPDIAADALAGFSNLLRFQLYEAKNTYVPLEKEITYLQQFAEIAQLRKEKAFKVHWQLPEKVEQMQIPPLLLMPLLENAFKHSGSTSGRIDILLSQKDAELFFTISNTKDTEQTKMVNGFEVGGIGLNNIKKRLSLRYPDRHHIQVHDGKERYEVNLSLQLSNDERISTVTRG